MAKFERVYTGASWEPKVGYCRALRAGDHIYVTGTVAVTDDGQVFGPGDPYGQAKRAFTLIERAIEGLGGDKRAIVRTRMFVTDISHWEAFGRAHADFFEGHHPTTSMIEIKGLMEPELLIEIEADAYVGA